MEQAQKNKLKYLIDNHSYWCVKAAEGKIAVDQNPLSKGGITEKQALVRKEWTQAKHGQWLYTLCLAEDFEVFLFDMTTQEINEERVKWREDEEYWQARLDEINTEIA